MQVREAAGAPRRAARKHPNATTAGVSGSLSTLVIAGVGALGYSMEAATGAALTTVVATTALVIGSRGVKGMVAGIVNGFGGGDDDD